MTFDVFQQVFLLSGASNRVIKDKGTQTDLQQLLQSRLAEDLSGTGWSVAWGPVVWKFNPDDASTGPENSWFVAFHPRLEFEDGSQHPTYVVAIAGTPRKSQYVWKEQDFKVGSVSDFNAWVAGGIQNPPVQSSEIAPGGAYIATGTVDVVHLLLNTQAPKGAASEGKTLLEFISGLPDSTKVVTTGHSLGGALSPSLALALVRAGHTRADHTLTYPTAGASPGNVEFTQLFTSTLPPRKQAGAASYQGWNLNLVNTLDVVPQAWATSDKISKEQNLSRIPTLYGSPALKSIAATIYLAKRSSKSSGVVYKPLPSQYFTGGAPPPPRPDDEKAFIGIAQRQHVEAYKKEIGVPSKKDTPEVLPAGVTLKSEEEILFDYPLIIDLEWAREHPEEARAVELKVGIATYPDGTEETRLSEEDA